MSNFNQYDDSDSGGINVLGGAALTLFFAATGKMVQNYSVDSNISGIYLDALTVDRALDDTNALAERYVKNFESAYIDKLTDTPSIEFDSKITAEYVKLLGDFVAEAQKVSNTPITISTGSIIDLKKTAISSVDDYVSPEDMLDLYLDELGYRRTLHKMVNDPRLDTENRRKIQVLLNKLYPDSYMGDPDKLTDDQLLRMSTELKTSIVKHVNSDPNITFDGGHTVQDVKVRFSSSGVVIYSPPFENNTRQKPALITYPLILEDTGDQLKYTYNGHRYVINGKSKVDRFKHSLHTAMHEFRVFQESNYVKERIDPLGYTSVEKPLPTLDGRVYTDELVLKYTGEQRGIRNTGEASTTPLNYKGNGNVITTPFSGDYELLALGSPLNSHSKNVHSVKGMSLSTGLTRADRLAQATAYERSLINSGNVSDEVVDFLLDNTVLSRNAVIFNDTAPVADGTAYVVNDMNLRDIGSLFTESTETQLKGDIAGVKSVISGHVDSTQLAKSSGIKLTHGTQLLTYSKDTANVDLNLSKFFKDQSFTSGGDDWANVKYNSLKNELLEILKDDQAKSKVLEKLKLVEGENSNVNSLTKIDYISKIILDAIKNREIDRTKANSFINKNKNTLTISENLIYDSGNTAIGISFLSRSSFFQQGQQYVKSASSLRSTVFSREGSLGVNQYDIIELSKISPTYAAILSSADGSKGFTEDKVIQNVTQKAFNVLKPGIMDHASNTDLNTNKLGDVYTSLKELTAKVDEIKERILKDPSVDAKQYNDELNILRSNFLESLDRNYGGSNGTNRIEFDLTRYMEDLVNIGSVDNSDLRSLFSNGNILMFDLNEFKTDTNPLVTIRASGGSSGASIENANIYKLLESALRLMIHAGGSEEISNYSLFKNELHSLINTGFGDKMSLIDLVQGKGSFINQDINVSGTGGKVSTSKTFFDEVQRILVSHNKTSNVSNANETLQTFINDKSQNTGFNVAYMTNKQARSGGIHNNMLVVGTRSPMIGEEAASVFKVKTVTEETFFSMYIHYNDSVKQVLHEELKSQIENHYKYTDSVNQYIKKGETLSSAKQLAYADIKKKYFSRPTKLHELKTKMTAKLKRIAKDIKKGNGAQYTQQLRTAAEEFSEALADFNNIDVIGLTLNTENKVDFDGDYMKFLSVVDPIYEADHARKKLTKFVSKLNKEENNKKKGSDPFSDILSILEDTNVDPTDNTKLGRLTELKNKIETIENLADDPSASTKLREYIKIAQTFRDSPDDLDDYLTSRNLTPETVKTIKQFVSKYNEFYDSVDHVNEDMVKAHQQIKKDFNNNYSGDGLFVAVTDSDGNIKGYRSTSVAMSDKGLLSLDNSEKKILTDKVLDKMSDKDIRKLYNAHFKSEQSLNKLYWDNDRSDIDNMKVILKDKVLVKEGNLSMKDTGGTAMYGKDAKLIDIDKRWEVASSVLDNEIYIHNGPEGVSKDTFELWREAQKNKIVNASRTTAKGGVSEQLPAYYVFAQKFRYFTEMMSNMNNRLSSGAVVDGSDFISSAVNVWLADLQQDALSGKAIDISSGLTKSWNILESSKYSMAQKMNEIDKLVNGNFNIVKSDLVAYANITENVELTKESLLSLYEKKSTIDNASKKELEELYKKHNISDENIPNYAYSKAGKQQLLDIFDESVNKVTGVATINDIQENIRLTFGADNFNDDGSIKKTFIETLRKTTHPLEDSKVTSTDIMHTLKFYEEIEALKQTHGLADRSIARQRQKMTTGPSEVKVREYKAKLTRGLKDLYKMGNQRSSAGTNSTLISDYSKAYKLYTSETIKQGEDGLTAAANTRNLHKYLNKFKDQRAIVNLMNSDLLDTKVFGGKLSFKNALGNAKVVGSNIPLLAAGALAMQLFSNHSKKQATNNTWFNNVKNIKNQESEIEERRYSEYQYTTKRPFLV